MSQQGCPSLTVGGQAQASRQQAAGEGGAACRRCRRRQRRVQCWGAWYRFALSGRPLPGKSKRRGLSAGHQRSQRFKVGGEPAAARTYGHLRGGLSQLPAGSSALPQPCETIERRDDRPTGPQALGCAMLLRSAAIARSAPGLRGPPLPPRPSVGWNAGVAAVWIPYTARQASGRHRSEPGHALLLTEDLARAADMGTRRSGKAFGRQCNIRRHRLQEADDPLPITRALPCCHRLAGCRTVTAARDKYRQDGDNSPHKATETLRLRSFRRDPPRAISAPSMYVCSSAIAGGSYHLASRCRNHPTCVSPLFCLPSLEMCRCCPVLGVQKGRKGSLPAPARWATLQAGNGPLAARVGWPAWGPRMRRGP